MRRVVILTLHDPQRPRAAERVPVLACADALKAGGADVELVTAASDAEIDATVRMLPAPASQASPEAIEAGEASLVVAAASDAELRGVIRRIVRRYAPPPSKRPAELPPDRTVFDLPPMAVLPLAPAVPPIVAALGLPSAPDAVAASVLGGRTRRLDLLRTDAGSVTLHRVVLGGSPFRARIECDDTVLSTGDEPVLATAIVNCGQSDVDGLSLVPTSAPDDGLVEVAVAVPVLRRRLLRAADVRIEVRRTRGRAMSVTLRDEDVPVVDDGVSDRLSRKKSWWTEPGAWGLYT